MNKDLTARISSLEQKLGYKFKNINETFQVFGIAYKLNGEDTMGSWEYIKQFCEIVGLHHVREIYKGVYDTGIYTGYKYNNIYNI